MGVVEKVRMEESEISDQDSVEEISEEDFKVCKRQHKASKRHMTSTTATSASISTSRTTTTMAWTDSGTGKRYWTGGLNNYSYHGGYAGSGLYNLAWAQAVQKKPLNGVLLDHKPTREKNASATGDCGGGGFNMVEVVVIDSGDEEEELEDGEIDFDATEQMETDEHEGVSRGGYENELDDGELEKGVDWIRQVVEKVTPAEAEKSFEMVCHWLRLSLERLEELVSRRWFPSIDNLIGQSFFAIQCVSSVFSSMSPMLKEQNEAAISRLISCVLGADPPLFSSKQKKEVEAVMFSISCPAIEKITKGCEKEEDLPVNEAILTDSNKLAVSVSLMNPLDKVDQDPSSVIKDRKVHNMLCDALRPVKTSSSRVRVSVGPLLDIYKVHDEESLPSPTNKSMVPQALPVGNVCGLYSATTRLGNDTDNIVMHPYETDALKAVSSYQQKFSRATLSSYDRLPSPTPSEGGKNGQPENPCKEVLSFSTLGHSSKTEALPILSLDNVSPALNMSSSTVQGVTESSGAAMVATESNPTLGVAPKRRDPRLQYLNPDTKNGPSLGLSMCVSMLEPYPDLLSSKKHRSSVVGPALKKQRNDLVTSLTPIISKRNATSQGSQELGNGALVATEIVNSNLASKPHKFENGCVGSEAGSVNHGITVSGIGHPPNSSSISVALLSSFSNVTSNTSALTNLLKEEKKSIDTATSLLHRGTSSSFPPFSPSEEKNIGLTPMPSQAAVTGKSVKICMKPQDPRRMLQNNASIQKNRTFRVEHSLSVEANTGDALRLKKKQNLPNLVNGAETTAVSLPAKLPDISVPLTENLKNIADISVLPTSVTSPITSQNPLPQGRDVIPGNVTCAARTCNSQQQTDTSLNSGGGPSSSSPQGIWGDVDHQFNGYDDQQKAAIQRERARRIEEQKKMFAAQKLCLVLDLDHTLLNSAKFSEVDAVHDGILRKKEKKDRDKVHRHLFRFPNMGMWTKLRPGIWHFLRRASELYELHLYTMGNKLYATEMAKLLDPTETLFAGRVISRGDDDDPFDGDERVPKVKDLGGVLGMESAVVIIDDSVRVWPHNKLNLIIVERYTYFPCSRRQFGLPGPSLLEIDHDERPEDGTLASSLAVIERLHHNFFSNKSLDDLDVRKILASEQRKILSGCRIVFSRVFPIGEANPHLHPLWQTAEQFGAICVTQLDEQVTHVVANSLGTDKVKWALSTGRHVVHPGWVEASSLLYRRANEQDFAIKP